MGTIELISTIGVVLTIIGSIYAFFKWAKDRPWLARPSRVYLDNGNIYLLYPNGSTKQITFSKADYTPVLGKKRVIFFRHEKVSHRHKQYTRYKLMSIATNSLSETIITDQKPFSDGLNGSFEILQPGYPVLSEDQSLIFFTIEKWVTAFELVQVNIKTGKWTELFSVDHFEIIAFGKYRNKLLAGVSEIRDQGRCTYYKVCDYNGRTLLDLGDYDDYMIFRSNVMVKGN